MTIESLSGEPPPSAGGRAGLAGLRPGEHSFSCPRDDVGMDDIGVRVHTAIAAGDWDAVRPLLNPYLYWTDSNAGPFAAEARRWPCSSKRPSSRPGHGPSSCGT